MSIPVMLACYTVLQQLKLKTMKDFLFVYRADQSVVAQRSPEEVQINTQKWMDWIGGIAAQNKLVDAGNRLYPTGKVVRGNQVITDGPFTEVKETLGGYSLIKAGSLEEAVALSKGCPIYEAGGSLEIREIHAM